MNPRTFNYVVLTYHFIINMLIMKVDVFVGLVRLHWFFTEKIHKLKVQLSDPRVTQERDVIMTAPV